MAGIPNTLTWEEAVASGSIHKISIAIARGLAPFPSGSPQARNYVLDLMES